MGNAPSNSTTRQTKQIMIARGFGQAALAQLQYDVRDGSIVI